MVAGAPGNLEEACSPAIFSSQRSKPGTSRVAGETKAQSIAFINKEN